MEDLDTSTAAAALFQKVTGRAPGHLGMGLVTGGLYDATGERQLYQAIVDYLARSPFHRHLGNEEHAPWSTALAAGALPAPNWRSIYPQGSFALGSSEPDLAQAESPWDFSLLSVWRHDVASLARFSQRLDHAAWHLCIATEEHDRPELWHRPGVRMRRSPRNWVAKLTQDCFARWNTTKRILLLDWAIPDRVEPLYRTAFWSLCELSPADSQLKILFVQDRPRACHELVRHVDAYAHQLELASELSEAIDVNEDTMRARGDRERLRQNQELVLEQAGEQLTLTQAAQRLGISRQALHKKLKTGAALGVMIDGNLVIPAAQLVTTDQGLEVVPGLRDLLRLFDKTGAGSWSALQYLVEHDPALNGRPIDQLRSGQAERVFAMARSFLGLDEG